MRIIPQEELDLLASARENVFAFWRRQDSCEECVTILSATSGCSEECEEAGEFSAWFWHGKRGEVITPENVHPQPRFDSEDSPPIYCSKGHAWPGDALELDRYIRGVHARAATIHQALGTFDEEAERARLMPV